MDISLQATKLRIPPPTRHFVRRARLVNALEDGIHAHKLVLITAPAGYGKTMLLAHWARASRFPVVWLSVGAEDNDFACLFRYLLTAWEALQPEVRDSPLGLLLGAKAPERDAVLSAFLNAAQDMP